MCSLLSVVVSLYAESVHRMSLHIEFLPIRALLANGANRALGHLHPVGLGQGDELPNRIQSVDTRESVI